MEFKQILKKCGLKIKKSIFSDANEEILFLNMPEPEDLSVCDVSENDWISPQPMYALYHKQVMLNDMEEYRKISSDLDELSDKIKEASDEDPDNMRRYREERKHLQKEKDALEVTALEKAYQTLYGSNELRKTVCWKGNFYFTTMSALASMFVHLKGINRNSVLWKVPIITSNTENLSNTLLEKKTAAVEGGPCLFGVDEVQVIITLDDDKTYIFDFVTEHTVYPCDEDIYLTDFASEYKGRVKKIEYNFMKDTLTEAEYQSLLHVFDVADAFGVKAYIPLPDFSYKKYMDYILDELVTDEQILTNAKDEFAEGLRGISVLYLEAIERLKKKFSDSDVTVVYMDSEQEKRIFEEKREKYLTGKIMKSLTSRQAKRESIIDYVTMPALPFYLDGITNIIQVDCMDEADSCRKCRKLHKGVIEIYPLMYPEDISDDGVNTVYYTDRKYKVYHNTEDEV